MKILILSLLIFLQAQLGFAQPSEQQLADYFALETVADEENAFIAITKLAKVDISAVEKSFGCSEYYGETQSFVPVTDFSCIEKNGLQESWKKNSDIVLKYQNSSKLPRFYESEFGLEYGENFLNINKLIATKIEAALSENNVKVAHSLWARNIHFLQDALSDKQSFVTKSIILVAYGFYERLGPTMLTANFDDEQKKVIRDLLSFEIANMEEGWNIKDSFVMDYNFILSTQETKSINAELSREIYALSEDSKKLYQYPYSEMSAKAYELIDKYKIDKSDAMAMAITSKESPTTKLLVSGVAQAVKLLVSAKRKDLLSKIALASY